MPGRAALVVLLVLAAPVLAQQDQGPAELPPPDFAGQQYVDSNGCLFMRAGRPGEVIWLPRVTREGVPLCDNPPSGGRVSVAGDATSGAEAQAAPAASAPVPAGAGWYVAVGSFGQSGNIDRALTNLRALDYPVARGRVDAAAQLETVFAGPFATEAGAADALARLRGQGFPDAMVVRRQD